MADEKKNVQDFMTAVSLQCKIWNHHPEWSNVRINTISRYGMNKNEEKGLIEFVSAGLQHNIHPLDNTCAQGPI